MKPASLPRLSRRLRWWVLGLLAGLGAGCATVMTSGTWTSKATPEGQGLMREVDGKRVQVRYREAPFTGVPQNWEQWPTYAYEDTRRYPPPKTVPLPNIKGDPVLGRRLFLDRAKAPCSGCHLIPGADVWPAGSVGPDLSLIGHTKPVDEYLFNVIYDARVYFPNTTMPPWGTAGIFTPEEVMHLVAFLKTQTGNPPGVLPPEKDPARNPATRPRGAPDYGDPLDPTANPALLQADAARALWRTKGAAGKACADCHTGGLEQSMKGVATGFPKYLAKYQRVMSVEDFLAVHGPETTGRELLAQSADNLGMSILVKMQSNGMPVKVDVSGPAAAAIARGKALYEKRVGQRNNACMDCHDRDKGGDKFIGGRLLAVVQDGLTRNFPVYRTNFARVWDIRKRFQWCMMPLGMNYLSADAPEYADMELFFTTFDNGKPMQVPGIRH